MGSGKSHWGRHWGRTFDLVFYDLDEVIEQQEGKTIRQIFETEGEEVFRRKEHKALVGLIAKNSGIIACGGGTPCFHGNMRRMNKAGVTIWLKTPIPNLVERLLPELGHRPVLAHTTPETLPGFIAQKLTERAPFYNRCMYQFNTQYLKDDNFKLILERCKRHF